MKAEYDFSKMNSRKNPYANNPKRHHFVPRFYLENFVDADGFLHLFDKKNKIWRPQKPDKCMHINKYYRQEVEDSGVDPNILEKTLGEKVEASAKAALRKLANLDSELSTREWADAVIYLAFQRIRVPRQIEAAKELLRGFVLAHTDADTLKKVIEGKWSLKVLDSFKFDYMKMTLEHFHPKFLRMEWEIVQPIDSEFLTTDSPVTFFNPKVVPPFEPGLDQIGTVVLFPIKRDRLLLMRYREAREGGNPLDLVPALEGAPETLINFRRTWPKEQVNRHNNLMIELSDRLVAASSKSVLEDALGYEIKGN